MEKNMSLNAYVEALYRNALDRFSNNLEMHYIHAVSKLNLDKEALKNREAIYTNKLDEKLIEKYLKRRGYVLNVMLGKPVWVNGFTCVQIHEKSVEVWTDRIRNAKSVFVSESHLTGIPLTLDYMESI